MSFKPGKKIELREVWRDRTWEIRTGFIVSDDEEAVAIYTPAGSAAIVATGTDGTRLRLPPPEWDMSDTTVPPDRSFLAVHPADASHTTLLIRDDSWRLLCWYINLESPLRRTASGFEYTDHFLDVIVEPDLSNWRWKDEDELAEAIDKKLVTAMQAREYYAEGKRAVERLLSRQPPYDRPWENWVPAD